MVRTVVLTMSGWEGSTVGDEDPLDAGLDDDVGGRIVGEGDEVESRLEVPGDAGFGTAVDHTDGEVVAGVLPGDLRAGDLRDEVALGGRRHPPEPRGDSLEVGPV